ncbi:serine hydroxymethyltransferase [Deltaproteobacteria bacterium Smac51]|nr:serine hydroxymethyltransferase [Deltaproteobacteria bacterium Smac51]
MLKSTRVSDPALYDIVARELDRQEHNIEMIASESTAPTEVLELSGCVFNNKTTEGYPGNRFQAGSHVADDLERLAIQRCKDVYGAEHVNMQPYSGSTANYSVYSAIMEPGDTIMGMRLDQGGHLTHGSPVNFNTKFYKFLSYGVDEKTELIDYDALAAMAKENKPKLIIAGASSYPRLIDYERMAAVAKEVGAYFLADMAHISGLVGAGVIPSPVPYADFVTSSTSKTICGARGGFIMCKAEHAKKLDKAVFPGTLGSIHLQAIAANAWVFEHLKSDEFKATMRQILANAKKLAEALTARGFRIVSGGTDNHIVLTDLRPKNITGKIFQNALEVVGITVNKNMVPFDPASPFVTSGVRIGLTSTTQRGLKEPQIEEIADIMNQVAAAPEDQKNLADCKDRAEKLISGFPLYPAGYFED